MLFYRTVIFIKNAAFLTAAIMLTGLHLIVFQGVAWLQMYREISQHLPSEIAWELTFSGQEVCGLCEAVEEARASTQDGMNAWLTQSGTGLVLELKPLKSKWSPVEMLLGTLPDEPFLYAFKLEKQDPPPPKFVA